MIIYFPFCRELACISLGLINFDSFLNDAFRAIYDGMNAGCNVFIREPMLAYILVVLIKASLKSESYCDGRENEQPNIELSRVPEPIM